VQRSRQGAEQGPRGAPPEQPLLERIAALEAELAVLRSGGGDAFAQQLAQLREANENLVLAAINAQTLRDAAEAANRRQNEFLAMLAHELRNPLAPISMAAALLERMPNAPEQLLSLTEVIGRQVGHMAHLLDDLLDAARISSGKIKLAIEPVLLSDVIAQAVETVQPRLEERRQALLVDVPDEAIVIDGDRVRLTQVFTNLLGNASKYTGDDGEIRLAACVANGDVVVTVGDNGSGIGPEVIPHIFDLFTQGPRSLARSEGGLGIGLNVVRNLVAMHAGSVRAESEGAGRGSTFTVTLPLSELPQASALVPRGDAGAAGGGCAVLIIEDNADACATLQYLLAMEGHAVSAANDGRSGLAAAIEHPCDVLVCDIGLPALDGYGVIRALRQSPGGARPYAIALSGYCQAEDRARAIDAGFDQYLVKPVRPDALLALIESDECRRRRLPD
jgi:signal transduction histidine kinase/ActR/RegA family two-component response regulator